MNNDEIKRVLELHQKWIYGEPNGVRAYLCEADLRGANLYGAYLCGANLCGANLCGAINIPFIPMACPDSGEFVGWKKTRDKLIVKLLIPAEAKRSSATTRKCRCDKALVLDIQYVNETIECNITETISYRDSSFVYKKGEWVEVANFYDNRWEECAPGIHFFINRQEAVEYIY